MCHYPESEDVGCGIGCSKNHTFLKIITEHPRKLYIGQLEKDETKNYSIIAVLVIRNGQNILQKELHPKYKEKVGISVFCTLPFIMLQHDIQTPLDQFV